MPNGLRITIAEDDEQFIVLLHYLLTRAFRGSSFAMFSNTEDALRHIQNSGTDILVTDHGMGRVTGTDLVKTLRSENNRIPIIMLSGYPDLEEEAITAGANEFLSKDQVLNHLVESVKKAMIVADKGPA